MFEPRLLRRLDWLMLAAVLVLSGLGLAAVYSASRADLALQRLPANYLLIRQATWLGVGLVALLALLYPEYSFLSRWRRVLYVVACLLLLAVLRGGQESGGAMRWIALGPFNLQPSEFAKFAMIVGLAGVFATDPGPDGLPGRTLARAAAYLAPPFLLVFRQPDLGTALVLGATWLAMAFVAGAKRWHLITILAGIVLVFSLAWNVGVIKDYQKDRLRVFIDPQADPLGAGYHVIQSKIAIGSGRLAGKGLLHGTQSQLRFIPEQHTDFVFTVIGEELGLVGGATVLALYLLLVWRLLTVAEAATDRFGGLLAAGAAAMFTFQGVVNMGMTMGVMPVTGIPLPFLSYGGSSMLTNLAVVGIALNVGMRRQKIRW